METPPDPPDLATRRRNPVRDKEMPTTHSEWLTRVCGVCLGKNSDLRKISDSDLKLIKQFNQSDYDMERKPSVLCRSCYKTLQFISENGLNAGRNLPIIDYENLRLPVVTRQQQMYCDCIYCNVGMLNKQQMLSRFAELLLILKL